MPHAPSHRAGRPVRFRVLAAALGIALAATVAAGIGPARAGPCKPPLKELTGICVAACPGGYEDFGNSCVYRNESR